MLHPPHRFLPQHLSEVELCQPAFHICSYFVDSLVFPWISCSYHFILPVSNDVIFLRGLLSSLQVDKSQRHISTYICKFMPRRNITVTHVSFMFNQNSISLRNHDIFGMLQQVIVPSALSFPLPLTNEVPWMFFMSTKYPTALYFIRFCLQGQNERMRLRSDEVYFLMLFSFDWIKFLAKLLLLCMKCKWKFPGLFPKVYDKLIKR